MSRRAVKCAQIQCAGSEVLDTYNCTQYRNADKGQFGIKDLTGPVGVVDVIGDTYEQTQSEGTLMVWMNMLNLAILLSANLGVMNLLPFPALDGGRLVFLLFEVIFRRPVNRQVEGMIHFAGLMLLMLLMVVVMYNDVMRIF
ncbi:MAG: site-2 protease family protein [Blautia hydrogenotrophica]